jgi:hypothetical protein
MPLLPDDGPVRGNHRVDVARPDDPSSKPPPGIPRMFNSGPIAQAEPARASQVCRRRINGDHFQEHIVAQPQE